MKFNRTLFRKYKPAKISKRPKVKMVKCPNCLQKTIRDESYSCQWCRYPLIK